MKDTLTKIATKQDFAALQKQFWKFLNNSEKPFDYERGLMKNYFDRIALILAGGNPPPYEVEIQPTSLCNAGCNHCFGKYYNRLENKLDDKDNMKIIIDQVLNFEDGPFKIERVKFCGSTGEPLYGKQSLYAIEQFHGKKYMKLFTNGLKLAEHKDDDAFLETIAMINNINISLDAGTTETLNKIKPGSRNVTIENILAASARIKEIAEDNTEITVSYVITVDNYKEIVEATKRSRNNADNIRFRIDLTDRNISKLHYDEIMDQLSEAKTYQYDDFRVIAIHSSNEMGAIDSSTFSSRDKGYACFTAKLWSCIGADGCLYPCGHVAMGKQAHAGSLLENDFKDLWESRERMDCVATLPGVHCDICSPFSLRTNSFLSYLNDVPVDICRDLYELAKSKDFEGNGE
jgi:MoaA/NifB/PqqE/SkfB family radical SAM enzyme